jgi:DNA polymerase-3 subunit epsilon
MWWTGNALGLDFETDGKDPLDARIITAATVRLVPGARPDENEIMVKPERDIPEKATEIHGISTEQAAAEGMERAVGIATVAGQMAGALGPDVPLVGHNASYDLTVLDREMRRVGIGHLALEKNVFAQIDQVRLTVEGLTTVFPVIDTLVLDKAVDTYRKGKRQLSFVAEHYGVPMTEGAAHGATADVIASLRIAIEIANRCKKADGQGPEGFDQQLMREVMEIYSDRKRPNEVARAFAEVGRMTLADLHCAQVRWAAEQARSLREYFVKLNDPEKDPAGVSEDWPLRTLTTGTSTVETVDTELV